MAYFALIYTMLGRVHLSASNSFVQLFLACKQRFFQDRQLNCLSELGPCFKSFKHSSVGDPLWLSGKVVKNEKID
jgi:hypothetical protein